MARLKKLIEQLASEDRERRFEATKHLYERPNRKALDPLLRALDDEFDMVRRFAALALGKIGDPAALPALLNQAQNNPDSGSRSTASAALGDILETSGGVQAFDVLLGLLGDGNATVRAMAAQALGKLGDRRGTAPLLGLLTDSQHAVRGRAIEALADIGDPDAVEPLADYYWRTEGDRRVLAQDEWAEALRVWREKRDPRPLVMFLKSDVADEPIIGSIQRLFESVRR